jgi:hypothetical protein
MVIVRKVSALDEVNLLLRGAVLGSVELLQASSALYLHGKTLIFTSPVGETVTFASSNSSAQTPLTLLAVLDQIAAQTTGVIARLRGSRLELVETTPSLGIAVSAAGTANAQLGFNASVATSGKVYAAPGGSVPAFVSLVPSPTGDSYVVVTNE